MKEQGNTIRTLILCVLLVVSLFRIGALNQDVQQLRNELQNSVASITNEVAHISSNVQNSLEEQNNLLESSEWQLIKLNAKAKTAVIHCEIVPKEYQAQHTTAILYGEAEKYPLQLQNGKFMGEITVPLVDGIHVDHIELMEKDTVRTQKLDWDWIPINMVMDVSAMYVGSRELEKKQQPEYIKYHGDIEIFIDDVQDLSDIQSVAVVQYMNDKEIERQAVSLDSTEPSQSSSVSPTPDTATEQARNIDYLHLYAPIAYEIMMPENGIYEIWVEIRDRYGLVYRVCVNRDQKVSSDSIHNEDTGNGQASVYDTENHLLYIP